MRALASIFSVLTVLAGAAMAAALGLAMVGSGGSWMPVLITGGAALACGAVSVALWGRIDD